MFHVKHLWEQFHESQDVFEELGKLGKYSHVDLEHLFHEYIKEQP